jgi:membrane protein DedA with SNARE-associated domain
MVVTDSTAQKSGADDDGRANGKPNEPAPGPLDPLVANLAEIERYLSNYLIATKDGLQAAARRTIIVAAVAISVGVFVLTLIAAATVLFLHGLASAAATAAGTQMWVGEIIVGAGAIVGCILFGFFGTRGWLRSASRTVRRKYEQRHIAQRANLRRDRPGHVVP